MTQENDTWYNADGLEDDNGCYDAAGHFYAERAASRYDYFDESI